MSKGQELGNLLAHAYPINRAEYVALERDRSPIVAYTLTVQHPKRGRLVSIGDHEANWLCTVNSVTFEECNGECVELKEEEIKEGSAEHA